MSAVEADVEQSLQSALERARVYPALASGVRLIAARDGGYELSTPTASLRLAEPLDLEGLRSELLSVPPARWDPQYLLLWQLGAVYLRDESSEIAPEVSIVGRRLLVLDSTLRGPGVIRGDGVLLDDAYLNSFFTLSGPCVVRKTELDDHCVAGPEAVLSSSYLAPFVRAGRNVRIDDSAIGSHCAISGATHREKYPLGPKQLRASGVTVERGCWVGQGTSLTAGALLRPGVIVAPNSVVTSEVGPHVLLAGNPSRAFPIDLHLHGLSDDQAREAGSVQGARAAFLPVFGPFAASFPEPSRLELAFREHPAHSGASSALLAFQEGAARALAELLLPSRVESVELRRGEVVRVILRWTESLPAHRGITHDVPLRRGRGAAPESLRELWELIGPGSRPAGEVFHELLERRTERGESALSPDEFHELLAELGRAGGCEPVPLHRDLGMFPELVEALKDPGNAHTTRRAPKGAVPGELAAARSVEDPPSATGTATLRNDREWGSVPGEQHRGSGPHAASATEVLAALTAEVTALLPPGVTLDAGRSFVSLGIDSLSLASLAAAIEDRFGIAPPDLIRHDSLERLSSAVTAALATPPR